jgi:hypothetical protein
MSKTCEKPFTSTYNSFLPHDGFNMFFRSYKLKVDACEKGTAKEQKLRNGAVNYLFVLSYFLLIG